MPENYRKKIKPIPDFDILSEDPLKSAQILKERLIDNNFKNIKILKAKGVDEVIPEHYEITVDGDTIAFIYKPLGCHSYNKIKIDKNIIKIATIDTMLSFYLAFIYANRLYYDENRILCMAELLFKVQAIMHPLRTRREPEMLIATGRAPGGNPAHPQHPYSPLHGRNITRNTRKRPIGLHSRTPV